MKFTTALATLLLASNLTIYGNTNEWKLVAADAAAQRATPGFVSCANVWKMGGATAGNPAATMFHDPAITVGFSGLEDGKNYELELTFLSDSNDRKLHIVANGNDLEKSLALPQGVVLRKRWHLPKEIVDGDDELIVKITHLAGPNAILSSVALYADKADAKALTALPARINEKIVAWETAAQHSLNSFVQCTNRWEMGGAAKNASPTESFHEMFFDSKSIKAVLHGVESDTHYGLELSFLSDSTDRVVSVSAGDRVLQDRLVLPKAHIKQKYFPLPPETIKDGSIEFTVTKVAGPNAILSGLAVFANKPKAKALEAPSASPLPAEWIPIIRLSPRPAAVSGVQSTKLDLNGTWKFNPAPSSEFWKKTADSGWKDIQVPGEWVMQGFTVATNVAAGYCRDFPVPNDWNRRRVKLRCDAVYSDAKIWINGREAGAHLGGFTPFELDVTQLLKLGANNTISLTVKNESRADTLASGSQYAAHPLGGIPRKIYLFVTPELNIADLYIRTEFDREFMNATLVAQVQIANDSTRDSAPAQLDLNLLDSASKPVAAAIPAIKAGQSFTTELRMPVTAPHKWDAEHPNLYTLSAVLKDGNGTAQETLNKRIGFRQVEVRGNQLFINNAPVKLRGVCRHETHPLLGRATTPELCRKDVELFRAMNVNHIRTSHYPPQEEFIEACNELGMFVEVEAPLCFCWDGIKQIDPANLPYFIQAQTETTLRDRSEPSVIMWSIGNECFWGRNFEASLAIARKLDGSRPCLFDSGGPFLWPHHPQPQPMVDIDAPHYPSMAGFVQTYEGNPRPTLLGEYAHLNCYNRRQFMTDPGLRDFWGEGMAEMWRLMLAMQACLGGNIWAAIDDFFFLPSGDVVGYGNWGPLDGWRRTKPEYWHLKKIYSPLHIVTDALPLPNLGKPINIPVENRHYFSDLNELRFAWTLGNQSGTVTSPSIAPGQHGELLIPITDPNPNGKILELKAFSSQNEMVDAWRFTIGPTKPVLPQVKEHKVTLTKNAKTIAVQCGDARWTLDAQTGILQEATVAHKPIAIGGPTLMLMPFLTYPSGCAQFSKTTYPPVKTACSAWRASQIEARETTDGVEIEVAGEYAEARGQFLLNFTRDGKLNVTYDFKVKSSLESWQLGVVFDLPRHCDTLTWKRKAQWSYYPADHIGRAEGIAKASTGKPLVSIYGPRTQPDWSWSLDETELGANDFCSLKRNIFTASLCAPDGSGLGVFGGGTHHTRCWLNGNRVSLLVAEYANAGRENSLNDFAAPPRNLRLGDTVTGSATIAALPR